MILHELKSHLAKSTPVTREFVALMDATFRYYADLRTQFLADLPQHLLQSELVSLVNVELKARLFNESFCEGIQDALKSLRRAIIRLEDLRAEQPAHPASVNDLARLAALSERVEALYQKHWEFYRYQSRLTEADLVGFVLEIDAAGYEWDTYLTAFNAVQSLAGDLASQPCPEQMAPLRISYERQGPQHFSIATIQSLMGFLESGYRFVCAAWELDPQTQPLTLLQVDVAHPVAVQLAVPEATLGPYRRFLQYLFLKDMLKREALLKVVFEATMKESAREKPLAPATLAGFQKELLAALKQLPEDGRFGISDRVFPDDGIRVLQEFTNALDERQIGYDALLRGDASKARSRGKAKAPPGAEGAGAQKPAPQPPSTPPVPPAPRRPDGEDPGSLFTVNPKQHIAVLTGGSRREGGGD